MNLYILKQKEFEGVGTGYVLVSELGEGLASCLCKSDSRASIKRAILKQCPVIVQKGWKDKFGSFKILFLGDDGMSEKMLIEKNIEFYKMGNVQEVSKEQSNG